MVKGNCMGDSTSSSRSVHHKASETNASSSTTPLLLNQQEQLPDEIIYEILSRLPVKSLVRYLSVCKSWKTLISDPQFVKKHLSFSSKDTCFRAHQIIMNCNGFKQNFLSCPLYSLYNESITPATPFLYTPNQKRRSVNWIIGSCNGLICVGIEQNTVLLWNPSIRKSNMLPHIGNKCHIGSFTVFGFGYDTVNDDYKVVAVYFYPNDGPLLAVVKVYSLKTNCWRKIQGLPHGTLLDDSGKYVSGTLNWAEFGQGDSDSSCLIESFDLTKETYCEVPPPKFTDDCSYMTLGVLGDCLCILRHYYGNRADVWIMREYGVSDSWNLFVSLPYALEPGTFLYSVPLAVSNNGEILVEYQSKLVLFNLKNRTTRCPVIHDFNGYLTLESVLCIESLVLPHA